MRRWRVGTLSLGIVLIVLGVLLLVAQFNHKPVLDLLLACWPAILIVIGGEILWYVYSSKEPEPKVRYDIFSMLIILLMIFTSIGIYAITSTGIVNQIIRMASSSSIIVEIPSKKIPVTSQIEEIVLNVPRGNVRLESTDGEEVAVLGTAVVDAVDGEEADNLVNEGKVVEYSQGNRLYIQVIPVPYTHDLKGGAYRLDYRILLPRGKRVRVEGVDYCYLNISPEALGDISIVDVPGRINIELKSDCDVAIEALVGREDQLGGNVQWVVTYDKDMDDSKSRPDQVRGYLERGAGAHKVVLLHASEVTVTELAE